MQEFNKAKQEIAEGGGDVNSDDEVDISDIELLCVAIESGARDAKFDLNGDRFVDSDDMIELVGNLLGTSFGDVNLDGTFNSSDFAI